jgi:hypothetical protein
MVSISRGERRVAPVGFGGYHNSMYMIGHDSIFIEFDIIT